MPQSPGICISSLRMQRGRLSEESPISDGPGVRFFSAVIPSTAYISQLILEVASSPISPCSPSSPHRGPRLTDHRRHHYCRAELFILSHRHLTCHPHCHLQPHSHSHSHSRSLALAVTLPLPFPLPSPCTVVYCTSYLLRASAYLLHHVANCTILSIALSYLLHRLVYCAICLKYFTHLSIASPQVD